MTIRVKVETAALAHAAGFRYVRSRDVAVVSVTGARDTPNTSLETVLQACISSFEIFLRQALAIVPQPRILLFATTPFWDHHNAVSRRRGIWGNADLRWLAPGANRSTNVEIMAANGARFAGLVEIEQVAIFDAANFVRTHDASFLFVTTNSDLSDQRVRSLFKSVFPKGETAIDWSNAVDLVGKEMAICIRVSGGFDDREVAIDAFMMVNLGESSSIAASEGPTA